MPSYGYGIIGATSQPCESISPASRRGHLMTRVGFIGLGLIGSPMCRNILKAGHEVTVWNRTPSRMDELVAAGAKRSDSPREAAERSEITITIVSDSPDVEEVIVGDGGVIEGAAADSVVVDMSTISPSVTVSIAERLMSKGVHMMDAPVSGGVTGAEEGALSIMVGGEKSVFDRIMPIYQAMGSRITYCGDSGMGQITKLSNQIIGLGNLAAMCEALVFAIKAGRRSRGAPEGVGRRRRRLVDGAKPRSQDTRWRFRPGVHGQARAEGPAPRPGDGGPVERAAVHHGSGQPDIPVGSGGGPGGRGDSGLRESA